MTRHVQKTASFAALHFSVAFAVTYALTGDWRVSGAVALVEPCVNTVAFFFHELAVDAAHRSASAFLGGPCPCIEAITA